MSTTPERKAPDYIRVIISMLDRKVRATDPSIDVTTPAGAEWLCNDIVAQTGKPISVQTVKRVTGVLRGPDGAPVISRRTTMDIIAEYLGYRDLNDLKKFIVKEESSRFRRPEGLVDMVDLPVGRSVIITWAPDRRVCVTHRGDGWHEVVGVENSKLRLGDRLSIAHIMKGYPLIVREVIRDGVSLGPYSAAPDYGVTDVVVVLG